VPFCGDGDIASELYADRFILAADIDPARVATFAGRLPDAVVRVADCNTWPFAGRTEQVAVADLDSYSYPYDSFRAFWEHAEKADTLVLFFTDGERQAIFRTGHFRLPDGTKMHLTEKNDKRAYGNFWLKRYCEPWLREAVRPYRVSRVQGYLRGSWMLYWGAVCER
jgi:hypothetical protein